MTKTDDLVRAAIAAGGDAGGEVNKLLLAMASAMEPEFQRYFWGGVFSSIAGAAARTAGKPAIVEELEAAKRAVKKIAGRVH